MSVGSCQNLMREGGCLCGNVRYRAHLLNHDASICHCHMCQHWSGGMSVMTAVDPNVEQIGKEKMSTYQSSQWGERLFCKTCGSSLGWRMQDGSSTYLSAVSFDNVDGFALKAEIYIDEKPDFYALANETQKMTGAQIMAQYTEQGS